MATPTLSHLSRAIRQVEHEDDPMAAARALLPDMELALSDRVDDETATRCWMQLARAAAGGRMAIVRDPTDREAARSACLAALAELPKRRGRPPKPGTKTPIRLDPDVREDLERAVRKGRARSLSEEVNRRCRAAESVPEA